jgi:hypothetical protein
MQKISIHFPEIFYNRKRRSFTSCFSIQLSSSITSLKVTTDIIIALSSAGFIFTVGRENSKIRSFQIDSDCFDFITFPNIPTSQGTYIIPIGSNPTLKMVRLVQNNIEIVSVFEHETKVTSHNFRELGRTNQLFLLTCGTASGAVVFWKIEHNPECPKLEISRSNPTISHNDQDISENFEVKLCNSATYLSVQPFTVHRLAGVSSNNTPIDHVGVPVCKADPDFVFVTCGGKIQIWNLIQPTPVCLTIYDTGFEKISSAVYPMTDDNLTLIFIPNDSRKISSVKLSSNYLPKLRLPSLAALQLAKYKVTEIPFIFYSFIVRLPNILKSQYKERFKF